MRSFFAIVEQNPLRFSWGLSLFLVGLFRSNLVPMPFLAVYAQPVWLYGGLQCLAGLGLLLTLTQRLTWYGRAASILAVVISGMVGVALWQLGYTGALVYVVMTGMLLLGLSGYE